MATHIMQQEDADTGRIRLIVSGEMLLEDAELLEKLASESSSSGTGVTIDLADLDLLDSESATVLRRIASRPDIEIDGIEIFLQSAIDSAERATGSSD